jgi:hypothetical protein
MPVGRNRVPARGCRCRSGTAVCQPGRVEVSTGGWRRPAVLGGDANVEPPSKWRRSRPDVLLPAPWLAPRWAPNIVMVKQHMPWDGLNGEQLYTSGSGGGKARYRPCTKHTASTPSYPGSGPSWGGNTPTPACLIYMSFTRELQWCSLSCSSCLSKAALGRS